MVAHESLVTNNVPLCAIFGVNSANIIRYRSSATEIEQL